MVLQWRVQTKVLTLVFHAEMSASVNGTFFNLEVFISCDFVSSEVVLDITVLFGAHGGIGLLIFA